MDTDNQASMLKSNENGATPDREQCAYWSHDGQIYFTGGYAYGIVGVPMPRTTDGTRRWELKTLCLGKEEEVLAQLQEENAREEDRRRGRAKRPPTRKGIGRSFRGQHKYGAGLEI